MSTYKVSTDSSEKEKKHRETIPIESEEGLRAFLENFPDAIVFIYNGVLINCNKRALEMIGAESRKWLLYKHISDISPIRQPDGSLSSQKQQEIFSSVMDTGSAKFEWLHKKPCGDPLPVEISLTLLTFHGKHIFFAIWRDITQRKKTEEALRESEETARLLIDATDEAVFLVNKKGSIISANSRFAKNHGSDVRELINKNVFDFFTEETSKKIRKMIHYAISERKTIRFENEDQASWYEVNIYPINDEVDNISKVAIFMKDITSERRYEEALRESENKYRQIVDTANEGILAVNEDLRITLVNKQTQKMTGYIEEEMIGKTLVDFIYHEDRQEYNSRTQHRIQGKAQQYELRLRKKDGSILWVIISASPIFDSKNRFRGSIALFTDITERKMIEEEIRESEERYRTAIEHSNDGVVILLGDSFIYVNQKFVDMFGFSSPDEVIGHQQSSTIHPDDADLVTTMNSKRQMGEDVPQQYEFKGKRKDGSVIYLEVSATITQYLGQTVTLAYLRDITSRKFMENELLNSRKLESIGLLAGGIAHDFNNLLMSILGYISLAKIYLKSDGSKASEKLSEAEKTIDDAKNLTMQLLTFSRGGSPVKKVIRIEHVIKESARVSLSGSHIKCRYAFQEHLWQVKGDESQLKQVIHHLTLNAREAMPNNGTITFSARNTTVEQGDKTMLQYGDYVELSVADTGKGIDKEHLSQVFDPYFTTKDFGPQKGMGLGLAVCYSIIKKHGGHIEVESEVNEGATFKLYLPAEKQHAAKTGNKHPHGGAKSLKILVADDEETVLKTTSILLSHLGHDVYSVLDSREVADIYRRSKESNDPFDTVILDLVSPNGPGGAQVLGELLKIDPYVHALLSSGYANDPYMIDYEQYGFKGVLQKPYRIEELDEMLKKVKKRGEGR